MCKVLAKTILRLFQDSFVYTVSVGTAQTRDKTPFRYASPVVDYSECKVQNAVAPVCKESELRDFMK